MASYQKLPSGRWRALIRKAGMPTRSETFDKESDAKKWAAMEEAKINMVRSTGKATVDKAITFAHLIDDYISFMDSVKPFGRSKMACLVAIKKSIGRVPVSKMNLRVITDFAMSRLKTGIVGATVAGDLSAIASALKYGRRNKHYDVDEKICYEVRDTVNDISNINSKERERTIEAAEIDDIFSAYAKKKRGFIPMPDLIRFAIATTLRQEEICKLKIEDLDANGKTVKVWERKDPKDKDRNHSEIPLFPIAWDLVEKHVGDRKKGRIFPYNSRSVSASFTRIVETCGIKDLHFHDLRHTAITALFELGLTIEQVALLSGHKDWKMLKRYTHIKANHVHSVYGKMLAAREAEKLARQADNISSGLVV